MFMGDLEAEIQAIVWRSCKMSWSCPVYFPPLCIQRDGFSVHIVHINGETEPSEFWTTLENELYLNF